MVDKLKYYLLSEPQPGDPDEPAPPAGDGDITFQKVIAGTDRGLDGPAGAA